MPIKRKRVSPPNPAIDRLRRDLIQEWRQPREDAPEPIILEEGGAQNRPTHLYVIWSEWAELNQQERSEIIMDAYEEVRGKDASLRVSVAMGLTSKEAERMNINYE